MTGYHTWSWAPSARRLPSARPGARTWRPTRSSAVTKLGWNPTQPERWRYTKAHS